jgi:CheY-like chemotaxis protein
VQIVARSTGSAAEVRVGWTGAPLDAAGRERAFDPRWESPQTDRQGLGMALLVAREAAELHGGSLVAEANALVLRLPLRPGGPELPVSAGHARVLVVDDDEPMARMMAEFLCEHGLDARWAAGGREALDKTAAIRPDLLVLDLRMPDLDGRALLHALWARGQRPRVVLLSADRDVAAAARELSCEGFVEKPFAPENLLAAVRRALPVPAGAAK